MPSRTLSAWGERVKTMLTSLRTPKGEQRQETSSAEKTTTRTTTGKRKKTLIKLPWKRRSKAVSSPNVHSQHTEYQLQAMDHSQANMHDSSVSVTIDEDNVILKRRGDRSNRICQLIGAGSIYNSPAFGISTNALDHAYDDDSDNESLTDTHCEDDDSFVHCRPSFRYRLHYGPMVENIENMFDKHKDLLSLEVESAKLSDEQQSQEVDDGARCDVQELSKSQRRVSMILPNPSEGTLCEAPVSSPSHKSSREYNPVSLSSLTSTPVSTRSSFLASKLFSKRVGVAPVLQDTTQGVSAHNATEYPYSISKTNGQRQHSIPTKHQVYTGIGPNKEIHVLDEKNCGGRRQLNAKGLQLSRSRLFKECGIHGQDPHGRYDIRSPHGHVETPRMTTFRNWMSGPEKDLTSGTGGGTVRRESRIWIPAKMDICDEAVSKRSSLLSMLSIQLSAAAWSHQQRGSKPRLDIDRTWAEELGRAAARYESRHEVGVDS